MVATILYQKLIELIFWDNKSNRNRVIYMVIISGLLLIASRYQGGVVEKGKRNNARRKFCRKLVA